MVSAGTLGSPAILERSGVGDPVVLERAGGALVAVVPGVGHDYEDHELSLAVYRVVARPYDTVDPFNMGATDRRRRAGDGWQSPPGPGHQWRRRAV